MRAPIYMSPGTYRRALVLASIIFSITVISLVTSDHAAYSHHRRPPTTSWSFPSGETPGQMKAKECPLESSYLRRHENSLTREIVYHSHCIRLSDTELAQRNVVADINAPLLERGRIIDRQGSCEEWKPTRCDTIDLKVPRPFPTQKYPQLLFGLATSYDRLLDSLSQLTHWLSGTGARLVVIIIDADNHASELGRLLHLFRSHDIDLVVAPPWADGSLGANEQHFTILRDMLNHLTPATKWLGVIDDDTFFPSLYPLAALLADRDHTKPAYLGALSESLDALQRHGMMAYGGAGAFLTISLAEQIEPKIESCLKSSPSPQGDALLKNCIANQTTTELELLPGLNQLDIMGDPSGFYESGRYPVSLHHWKSWHHNPVDLMAKTTELCGSCMMQRWRFGSDTVLSNGYSIVQYKEGIDLEELEHTEATFDWSHLYEWSLGPLRNKTEPRLKKKYQLVDSEMVGGTLRQLYLHRAEDFGSVQYSSGKLVSKSDKVARDELVELWWDWSSLLAR
ncbi:hypothetical protein V2G26_015760 [Clonostachys chloroleuca]|uniref:Glycosyltransferase family 31 protein n=1 Tax=Clonostachys chloroleuca TaxID=1926264 RepID=A0AA35QCR7_9HYPO|nr:unnamed protein product [Clonostachys chloroleuca]